MASEKSTKKRSKASKRRAARRRRRIVCAALFAAAALCLAAACHKPAVTEGGVSEDSAATSDTVAATTGTTAGATATAVPTTTAAPATTSSPQTTAAVSGTTGLGQAAKPLWIHVSIDKQNVTVYDAGNRTVESFVCSTGIAGSDTPKGTYKVQEKGYSFFSKTYQEGGYYWTQFSGDFLFHSVPFDKDKDIIPAEASKLGTKASHGCVRLSIENAKWIYDNIPRGTKVVIE